VRPVALLGTLLLLAPFTEVRGQEQPLRVPSGSRVRVTVSQRDTGRVVGVVVRFRSESLVVRTGESKLAVVPFPSITRLQVSRGRDTRPVIIGASIGALAGAIVGALAASTPECPPLDLSPECFPGVNQAGAALVGAALGALTLGLVAKAVGGERWEDIPLDRLRVSVAPQRDGRFAFGASIRF
jgi:hypothetical protein